MLFVPLTDIRIYLVTCLLNWKISSSADHIQDDSSCFQVRIQYVAIVSRRAYIFINSLTCFVAADGSKAKYQAVTFHVMHPSPFRPTVDGDDDEIGRALAAPVVRTSFWPTLLRRLRTRLRGSRTTTRTATRQQYRWRRRSCL